MAPAPPAVFIWSFSKSSSANCVASTAEGGIYQVDQSMIGDITMPTPSKNSVGFGDDIFEDDCFCGKVVSRSAVPVEARPEVDRALL